jgi:ABC-type transport system substrate-binding protein
MAPLLVLLLVCCWGCDRANPNNPYRAGDSERKVYYSTFSEPPKHLDPARAYSADEASFIAQIYEPPFQYHYLKRPYELVPLTAETIPTPAYYDADGKRLPDDAPAERVSRAVYEIHIRPGIRYQEHPCFAQKPDGSPRYENLADDDLNGVFGIEDFKETSSRELVAKDYLIGICRLADPRLSCPIYSLMSHYIVGMDAYYESLKRELERIREQRKAQAGATYNADRDERERPILLDYAAFPFEGVEVVDRYAFRLTLKEKYPQILYWLAMTFFAPIPEEAVRFYAQGPLIRRNITLDQYPVGTGAYRFHTYNPNREIVLVRNEHYRHDDLYPSDGEPSDRTDGLLADAGKPLPFIEQFTYKLEKEEVPRWSKFLQGYYDGSGISSENFDRAVIMNQQTGVQLSPELASRGMRLSTAVNTATYYLAFNMLDPVVGGYSSEKRKLRQAISIAVNMEEYIEIFLNGRAVPAQGPIPPGVFGTFVGSKGVNPVVYDWDARAGVPVRKPLDTAKRLLAEAGYPNGRDAKTGKQLTISFDNVLTGAGDQTLIRWYAKQFDALGIAMVNNATDYSRFQDKVDNANFQIISWGWLADYPDPENFLFLLYGPNSAKAAGGPNAGNYDNPAFNRLFEQARNMTNSPERLALIERMLRIAQEDAPWIWGLHPVTDSLRHGWVRNAKPHQIAYNTFRYLDLDPALRAEKRREWNRPKTAPLFAILGVFVAGSLPAIITIRRRERGR